MNKSFIVLLSSLLISNVTGQKMASNIQPEENSDLTILNRDETLYPYNSFTKVLELDNEDLLNGFSFGKPDVLKFKIDKNIDVIDKNEKNLGNFKDFYETNIKGKYLPCIEIGDADTALNYIDYVNETFNVRDLAIYSDDISVFKAFNEVKSLTKNYFVFDVSQYDLEDETTFGNLINVGNVLGINTYSIRSDTKNIEEAINNFAKFNKTTWVDVNEEKYTFRGIASGASGVIYNSEYDLDKKIKKFDSDGRFRPQFLAAHRGVVDKLHNENSLNAIKEAADSNADFVEIDLQISKDKEIFLCHNDLLSVTSDCDDKSTFQTTDSKKLKEYTLTDNGINVGAKFPTLKEVFEANKDNDLIFILEFKFDQGFKTASWDLAQYVHEVVKEYGYEDRVIGITFFKTYFASIKKHMPYMPTMYLGLGKLDTEFKEIEDVSELIKYLKKYNVGIDYGYRDSMESVFFNYLARGYFINSYTFNDLSNLKSVTNIATSDNVLKQKECYKDIHVKDEVIKVNNLNNFENEVEVEFEKYSGQKETKKATIKILDDSKRNEGYLTAIAYYYDEINGYGMYSNAFIVSTNDIDFKANYKGKNKFQFDFYNYLESIPELQRSDNTLIIIISVISSLLGVGIIAIISTILIRKKSAKIKK